MLCYKLNIVYIAKRLLFLIEAGNFAPNAVNVYIPSKIRWNFLTWMKNSGLRLLWLRVENIDKADWPVKLLYQLLYHFYNLLNNLSHSNPDA